MFIHEKKPPFQNPFLLLGGSLLFGTDTQTDTQIKVVGVYSLQTVTIRFVGATVSQTVTI